MKDKICIVSGATSGIGKVTATALASQGAQIIMLCRNKDKGEQVKEEIIHKTGNTNIRFFLVDFSSQKDIRKAAEEINASVPHIDLLVNNAGAFYDKRTVTEDNLELTFAVNHIGYFLLTQLLLDKIKKAPKARIVNVASQAQMMGSIYFDDINLEKGFMPMKAYAQSKLANIMFTFELAEKLKDTGITVNCLHPGVVNTGFSKNGTSLFTTLFNSASRFFMTPEQGAQTSIWLATSPEVEGISGKYFARKKEIRAKKIAYDKQARKRLWELSEQVAKIKYNL